MSGFAWNSTVKIPLSAHLLSVLVWKSWYTQTRGSFVRKWNGFIKVTANASNGTSVTWGRSEWLTDDPWKTLWRKKSELRKFWRGGGHTWARVFSERVTLKAESFSPLVDRISHGEHAEIKKDTSGQGCGGISFLISIVYLLSLFISRSLHYLQYMSIEILQFLWCKQ